MVLPEKYHGQDNVNTQPIEHKIGEDDRITMVFANGKKVCKYEDLTRVSFPDGYRFTKYDSGDIRQTFPNNKVVFFSAKDQMTHTTYPDGMQVFKFANGQVERHFCDG